MPWASASEKGHKYAAEKIQKKHILDDDVYGAVSSSLRSGSSRLTHWNGPRRIVDCRSPQLSSHRIPEYESRMIDSRGKEVVVTCAP